METAIHEQNLRLAELRFIEQNIRKQELQNKEREKSKQHKSSSSSSMGDLGKNLGSIFDSVASGLGSVSDPYLKLLQKDINKRKHLNEHRHKVVDHVMDQ